MIGFKKKSQAIQHLKYFAVVVIVVVVSFSIIYFCSCFSFLPSIS